MLTFYEEQELSDSMLIYEQLESDYKTYCNHCDDTPLSFNDWVHSGISYEKVWDDNKQAFVQEMFDDLPF